MLLSNRTLATPLLGNSAQKPRKAKALASGCPNAQNAKALKQDVAIGNIYIFLRYLKKSWRKTRKIQYLFTFLCQKCFASSVAPLS